MPGYVMHLVEAQIIIRKLRENRSLSDSWENQFLTGNLLPDTKLRDEKQYSHFWDPEQMASLALAPQLSRFLAKYGSQLTEPVVYGYFAHLYLDAAYVQRYWPEVIGFYDHHGRPQTARNQITDVYIRRLKQYVPVESFFSSEYYYGEYTKLNSYFIKKYQLRAPQWQQTDCSIDEVNLEDMQHVCDELAMLNTICHKGDEKKLQVFDLDHLESFLIETAAVFSETYGGLIEGGIK